MVKMSPLPTVENLFTPTTAWSTQAALQLIQSSIRHWRTMLSMQRGPRWFQWLRIVMMAKEIWSGQPGRDVGSFKEPASFWQWCDRVWWACLHWCAKRRRFTRWNTSERVLWHGNQSRRKHFRARCQLRCLALIHTSNEVAAARPEIEVDGAVKWTVNLDACLRGESLRRQRLLVRLLGR